jgi:hypothetical protein
MFFVDESIQHDLGYICLGFAYCEQAPDEAVNRALLQAGLTPTLDEYKSGARMVQAEGLHDLRNSINRIVLESCKLGLYIGSVSERPYLLESVVAQPQVVFVDEGILGSPIPAATTILRTNCNSKLILGIQLADFVAYHCSYLLKCALTGMRKKVLVDSKPHPLGGQEVELDWIVRTDLRRKFFVEYRNTDEIEGDDWFFKLAGYGAFFSDKLPPEVKAAAEETFDSMYFGCVW